MILFTNDQNSELTEIDLHFEIPIPILILMTRSRYVKSRGSSSRAWA
jgi:hypothetical protein